MPIDFTRVLLLYFIFRSVAAYRTVIVAVWCVVVSINHSLSIYLSIYLSSTEEALTKFETWLHGEAAKAVDSLYMNVKQVVFISYSEIGWQQTDVRRTSGSLLQQSMGNSVQ